MIDKKCELPADVHVLISDGDRFHYIRNYLHEIPDSQFDRLKKRIDLESERRAAMLAYDPILLGA